MDGFILNTSLDYDMDYDTVKWYYDHYYEDGLFYDKLEEFIKQRASS